MTTVQVFLTMTAAKVSLIPSSTYPSAPLEMLLVLHAMEVETWVLHVLTSPTRSPTSLWC